MKFNKNDEAVSPVIGVILMVAITVILAAVIAAFVFGMAGGISNTKSVAATAQQVGGDEVQVTYQGGQDNVDVLSIIATVEGTTSTNPQVMGNTVGSALVFNGDFSGRDHVVVTAVFTDSSRQVILDTYV
jgi:flagellin-like protein